MTDSRRNPDTAASAASKNSSASPPGMPRWAKVSMVVLVVALFAAVVSMLVAGGEHGPSRHAGAAQSVAESHTTGPNGHAETTREPSLWRAA